MKKVHLFTTLLLLLICSCNSTFTHNKGTRDEYYFPLTEIDSTERNDKLDTFRNQWYSKHLYTLKEPVLFNLKDTIQIYRFTHLGTWSRPYSYRIEKRGSDIIINHKQTSGMGGYQAGRLLKNKTKKLTVEQFQQVQETINKYDFWSLDTHGERGLDGEEWILEAYDDGKYHVLTRWSPNYYGNKEFVALCNLFGQLFNAN